MELEGLPQGAAEDKPPTKTERILRKSLELGLSALPGPWKTLAEIFLIVVE